VGYKLVQLTEEGAKNFSSIDTAVDGWLWFWPTTKNMPNCTEQWAAPKSVASGRIIPVGKRLNWRSVKHFKEIKEQMT
jgi:hypothetical protein